MPRNSGEVAAPDAQPVWLIAATRNPAKIDALNAELEPDIRVAPFPAQRSLPDEIEDDSLAAIAIAKAVAASRVVGPGRLVVATDGGLGVPALGDRWQPSRTRRFAGETASNLERAGALVAMAESLEGADRRIVWREALALAEDGALIGVWEAESGPGLLTDRVDPEAVSRGGGFWAPAVWRVANEGGELLVDLPPHVRSRVHSHWAQLATEVRLAVGRWRRREPIFV
jgi:inosine/xanthosine triphosphate pyrophosphatase family protein